MTPEAVASSASEPDAPGLEPEIETLNRVALAFAGHLDTDTLVKAVTDAGVAITGAAFGVFSYKNSTQGPAHYLSGVAVDGLDSLSFPSEVDSFGAPFLGAVIRCDDLVKRPSETQHPLFMTTPSGPMPARSCIAAPLRSRTGGLIGGLFFGHPELRFFQPRDERLLAGLAAHAAVALDNARLYREAKEARAVAESVNGLKDAFLATLSHELRTPLTAISGWAHLLQRGKLTPDETIRAVDTIIRNAAAQNQMIDELLDVSRIITGKLQLDLQPIEIGAVLKAAIGTVTPAANAKEIRLQVLENPAGNFVMGDSDRLQQVFWNLLSNAIKFTPRKGRVRVNIESVRSFVEVVVSDTGVGINPEFLPRMFERFSQDDSSSTRNARGLGLGLSIARQLVELHGGSIEAMSPGAGKGAIFTARFPRSPITAGQADLPVSAPSGRLVGLEDEPDLTGVRVLVTEDDDDARALIEKVLTTQGATVISVASAKAALAALDKGLVDVLVSDIEMPGVDGYQLIRELRARSVELGGAIPAAALTAHARTEDRLKVLRAGFQIHLAKPVQPTELVTVVASLVARRNGGKAGSNESA